jgi:opacity protein-like surface antigen
MTRHSTMAAALLAAASSVPAQAADRLSSSFWEAAYLNSTVDTGGPMQDEVEGFRAATSIGLLPYLSFGGDYSQRRYQSSRDSFGSVGFTVHTLDPVWQVFGAVTYERNDFDDNLSSAADRTEDGAGFTVGGRYALANLELHAQYKYLLLSEPSPGVDLKGSRYGAGVVLDLTHWWSLTADYSVRTHEFESAGSSSDVEYQEWTVGLRRYIVTRTDRVKRSGGILSGLFGADDAP